MFAERSLSTGVNAGRLTALLLVLAVGNLAAQQREVISKQISVGRSEASLELELSGGATLEMAIADGVVRLNGDELGTGSAELDAAWRTLLGRVLTLEDGPLVEALRGWSPPEGLTGDAREMAARMDGALEDALDSTTSAPDAGPNESRDLTLGALLRSGARLGELGRALDGVDLDNVRVQVDDDFDVPAGETIAATVVIVDGDLTVRGSLEGDVVAVGGSVRVPEGGRIRGDVRLLDARLEREGGTVDGDVVNLEGDGRQTLDEETRDEIREEARRELRGELGERSSERSVVGRVLAPVGFVVEGVAGVLASLFTVVILSLVGGVIVHLAHGNLQVAAETARRSPGRAAAVGLAGTFLALPVWLLGLVALVISIIGIPVALVWLPLFPVALLLAIVFGYFAVAHNVGVWVSRQRFSRMGWVRASNPYTLIAGGVLTLSAAFVASSVLELGGHWLGFLRVLFLVSGILLTIFAALVGFGAVLMTRAGRRPEFHPTADFFDAGWDADLEREMERSSGQPEPPRPEGSL